MASGIPSGLPDPKTPATGMMVPTVQAAVARTSMYYVPKQDEPGPDTPTADYSTMAPLWKKVVAFATGAEGMRKVAKDYLPKFADEDTADYQDRIDNSPFTNVYDDIVSGLASKPFSREVQFEDPDDVDPDFIKLYDDIDGRGNNLHVFSEISFREGLENAVDWILVDFTKLPPLSPDEAPRSLAEEQQLNARPYWVRVAAINVKAVYSAMVGGKEILTHVRFYEPAVVRNKFGEEVKERYRIFDREPYTDRRGQTAYLPATWQVLEKQKDDRGNVVWVEVDAGTVDVELIPMVPFVVSKRIGNGWAFDAPLSKLADMQIDAFRQESNLRNVELLTCFPMLTANGVAQPMEAGAPGQPSRPAKIKVGPRAVLFAPPQNAGGPPGSWAYIEPSSESVNGLYSRLSEKWDNMREIGMQPLAEASITVITSANISTKAKSALQAWTLRFKDALEQAFVITALWMGKTKEDAPGVDVYKDFGVDQQSDAALTALLTANQQKELSGETLRAEMKRRNVLGDSFNEEEEKERLAEEAANALEQDGAAAGAGEDDIDPVTGKALDPANDTGGEDNSLDPSNIEDPSEIDDDTLAKFFGARAAGAK